MASRLLRQAENQKETARQLKKAGDADLDPADLGTAPTQDWEAPASPAVAPPPAPRRSGAKASAVQAKDVEDTRPLEENSVRLIEGMALPGPDAPLSEIISTASRIVYMARSRYEDGQEKLDERYFAEAGPAVRLVHSTKAFKELKDPDTDKPYRGFRKWLAHQGVSKTHGYRMIQEIPVCSALEGLYKGPMPSGHIDVLFPVLRQHGEEALRKMWQTGEAGAKASRDGGRPTVPDLVRAREVLELTVKSEDDEPPSMEDPEKSFQSFRRAVRVITDSNALRDAMQYDPQGVRELVRQVLGAASGVPELLPVIKGDAQNED